MLADYQFAIQYLNHVLSENESRDQQIEHVKK